MDTEKGREKVACEVKDVGGLSSGAAQNSARAASHAIQIK